VSDERFAQCVLVVGGSLEKIDAQHAFNCVPSADTAGRDLAPVGEMRTQRGGSYVLFAKAGALDSVKFDFGHGHEMSDSLREAQREFADSIREVEMERADSIREAASGKADSLREAAQSMSDSIRAHVDSMIAASQEGMRTAGKVRSRVTVHAPPAPPVPPKH
jgi:hypothetical protein